MDEKNKQTPEQPNGKKNFNWTLTFQISAIVIFAALFAYLIYQVVVFDEAAIWIPILCLTIAVLVGFSFFKETFIFSKKAFRNRMIFYGIAVFVLALPNLFGNVALCYSGRYVNDKMFMDLIASQGTPTSALTVTILAELMLFAFLSAIILFILEMNIRRSARA